MSLGTRTIEVSVSEGNLHAELEALFRRHGYIHDDEDAAELRIGDLAVREGDESPLLAKVTIRKSEEVS